jgi:DNA-directed RNA polymerase specialized sigma subunit
VGLGLSQREIAERVGMSQMHVSRLLRAAMDELAAGG